MQYFHTQAYFPGLSQRERERERERERGREGERERRREGEGGSSRGLVLRRIRIGGHVWNERPRAAL